MLSGNLILTLVLSVSVGSLISAQPADGSSPAVQLTGGESWVEWSALIPADNLVLTISGPKGLYLKEERLGPRFDAIDEQGRCRPDGEYKWELVVQSPGEASQALSGGFEIRGGKIFRQEPSTDKLAASIAPGAPEHSVYVDQEGRVGIGTSVPGARLHVKGWNAGLAIEDTQAGGREYRLRSKESGDGSFGLFEEATGEARWLVDRQGLVGINTTTPTSTLTVDGYIESTKGFLVNGRPVGGPALLGSSQPLYLEDFSNSFFGYHSGDKTFRVHNSFFGSLAGENNTEGEKNSFFGHESGQTNTLGSQNSFFGYRAGQSNTTGWSNSFFGIVSGSGNTTGGENAFYGGFSGYYNTVGSYNSYFGSETGQSNKEGNYNSFFGRRAGFSNVAGHNNSFFGHKAGYATTANYNSFFGVDSGLSNTTGSFNAFFGGSSGRANTIGHDNSYFGDDAGWSNTTGNFNSFFGANAGFGNTTGVNNSFFGTLAGDWNTVESYNTFVGYNADLDAGPDPITNPVSNATAIGANAYVARSNSLVLGGVKGFNQATEETFVGIGTTSPDRQLVVEGSQALGKFRRYNATTPSHSPAFLFERGRGTNTAPLDIEAGDYLGKVQFRGRVGGGMPEYGALAFVASDRNQNGRFAFVDRDLVTERMVILNTGNVGIGTSAPTALLDVAGDVRVRGTLLYGAPATAVPDYVFQADYTLMSLPELEQYVRREKHLPNVPNASEIQDKGVNLGEFQMKLLEKIEELTLYTVEQAKMIERQSQQLEEDQKAIRDERRTNAAQQAELSSLKAELENLKQLVRQR